MFTQTFRRSRQTVGLVAPCARNLLALQQRNLNIHEHQSQDLMRKFGISVSPGIAASSPEEAFEAAKKLNSEDLVVKAQVLAGGRGLGTFDNGFKGGVHMANTAEEVRDLAKKMLGHRLVTKQTGAEGRPCDTVLVTERQYVRRECYLAMLLDRKTSGGMIIGSTKGGMDIEAVAEEDPTSIFRIPIPIAKELSDEAATLVADGLCFPKKLHSAVKEEVKKLYKLFIETDATQVEINPFVETAQGEVMNLDAKINFDDNAAFRQKEIFAMRDFSQEDPREVAAAKFDLNFIALDGSIGCLVNGAGLAMATMDIIKLSGGSPANFLDIGGGASETQVAEALKLIASDPKVKCILVNIFGGIMRCDVIALGLLNAMKQLNIALPLVVRLEGTNFEEAEKILEDSGMRVIAARELEDAARKAVRVAKIVQMADEAELNVNFELPL